MKHLYAGLIVGAIVALLITATIVMWAFLSQFVSHELATALTGAVILFMAASAVLDYVTEKR